MNWQCLPIEKIFELLSTSENGLSVQEAEIRLKEQGPNLLPEKAKASTLILFINQFKDLMVIILICAALISGFIGEITDSVIIIIIVILNATFGFFQEYKAGKALEALRKMDARQTLVKRNNKQLIVPAENIVQGDIVFIESGNVVPADMRLTELFNLKIDESALTGESFPAEKNICVIDDNKSSLGDCFNLAFKGTTVVNGRAAGIVVATGTQSELGKIAKLIQQPETITPLQLRMGMFGKRLTYVVLAICLILFCLGALNGEPLMQLFITSVSVAVAAIPEALPALITVSLAIGARRLIKKNALIRKLPAVETLGSVTFICTDKTGTLTANKMQVVFADDFTNNDIKIKGQSPLSAAMALNHNVIFHDENTCNGDPTEIALANYFIQQNGYDNYVGFLNSFPRIAEVPFDSLRKCMTSVHQLNGKYLVITKGAVESITEILNKTNDLQLIHQKAELMAKDGFRVIAFCYKIVDEVSETKSLIESQMQFAGLAALIDPARNEIQQSIIECKSAGIIPVMITGDHPATARAIAIKTGLANESDLVLTGKEIQQLGDDEFGNIIENVRIYARVNPEIGRAHV